MKAPTNKLSIYLIKTEYHEHKDILKDFDSLESRDIKGIGTFYYGESFTFEPQWIKKFFGNTLGDNLKLYNASSRGVLLIESKKRTFAIPFGYGWQYLNHGVYEERFGLKTTLNIIDPDKLRKIDKKNMSAAPKDTREQLTKSGVAADFGIDIEQDLIGSITGMTKDPEKFGTSATGKDALSLSVKVELSSIKSFLADCLERYESDDYKKDFGWIDQFTEVRDQKILNDLNARLIENLKNKKLETTWMAVPEVIEWEQISGFKYIGQTQPDLSEDINVNDFLATLSAGEKTSLNIDLLKRKTIQAIDAGNDAVKHHWNAHSCIYSEQRDDTKKKTFLLSNGKWYEITSDFAEEVNQDFIDFRDKTTSAVLAECSGEKEGDYNIRIAHDAGYCLMDKKLINHGGGYSKIEFCDLYTKDKKIIHIKHYGGSSVLSHLFSQGLVSGELFLRDKKFREKVNVILEPEFKLADTKPKPIASEYEIVFGVISSAPKELEVPFFSKVNLRNAKNRLETFGYKVSLYKILNQSS